MLVLIFYARMVAIDLVSRSVGLNDMDGGDEATKMERLRKYGS